MGFERESFSIDEGGTLSLERTEDDGTLAGIGSSGACNGRIDPALHHEVVEAARAVVRTACVQPRPVQQPSDIAPTWSLTVVVAAASTACTVNPSSSAYAKFDDARKKALASVCSIHD
jgi:hypothetical protein